MELYATVHFARGIWKLSLLQGSAMTIATANLQIHILQQRHERYQEVITQFTVAEINSDDFALLQFPEDISHYPTVLLS